MPSAPKLDAPQGQPLFDVQFRAISESLAGNGVLANGDLEVTDGTNAMEIDVASGTLYYVATEYSYGGASPEATLTQGDGTYDRWDTVAFDTGTSSVVVHEGTAEQYPTPPDISGGEVLLAIVYVASGATDIASGDILNWRAKFSNEAEEVHYDDSESFYGTDNVEGALDAANDLLVRRDYPTNSGGLVLVDMPVDGNAAAGTEQSYTFAIDGTSFLEVYAESDGAGGIQNPLVQYPNVEKVRLGQKGQTNSTGYQNIVNDGTIDLRTNYYISSVSGHGILALRDLTNDTLLAKMSMLQSGGFQFDQDIVLDTGETVADYTNKHVPRSFLDPSISGAFDLGTNPGAFGAVFDGTVDGNSAVGTVHSYGLNWDATELLGLEAESDGAGGIQNPRVPVSVPLALLAQSADPAYTGQGAAFYDTDDESPKYADSAGTYQRPLARTDVDKYSTDESGTVNSGNAGVVGKSHLADGESFNVYRAALLLDDGQAAPTDLDLVIITEANDGTAAKQATILAGDGATVYDKQTGNPLASYTNTSGGGQTVGVVVDNGNFNAGTGAAQDIFAEFKAEVVA